MKYTVRIFETAVYLIKVVAENEEEACELAEELFVQSEDINEFFSHVEDREGEVIEAKD